jgi:hypothetical protein
LSVCLDGVDCTLGRMYPYDSAGLSFEGHQAHDSLASTSHWRLSTVILTLVSNLPTWMSMRVILALLITDYDSTQTVIRESASLHAIRSTRDTHQRAVFSVLHSLETGDHERIHRFPRLFPRLYLADLYQKPAWKRSLQATYY